MVTAYYLERVQPYRVRMSCGHEEKRMMRPATAGVPWTPNTVVMAQAPCAVCRGEK